MVSDDFGKAPPKVRGIDQSTEQQDEILTLVASYLEPRFLGRPATDQTKGSLRAALRGWVMHWIDAGFFPKEMADVIDVVHSGTTIILTWNEPRR